MARCNLDTRDRHAQILGDELAHRNVGLVIDWRSGRSHEESAISFTTNLIALRSGNYPNIEQERRFRTRHRTQRPTVATTRRYFAVAKNARWYF